MQGNFFSRKRSGSSENVAASTTSSSIPTASEVQSVGTWKLIKGRVSQAMEDIKSSKQESGKTDINGDESDADSATINSSISDDFNEAVAFHSVPTNQLLNRVIDTDSESDLEGDLETLGFAETDLAKKSFSNKKGSTADTILSKINKTKEERRPHGKSLLRRRKRGQSSPARPLQQKDIEIESGVEITEEMSLGTVENVKDDEQEKSTKESNEILTNDMPLINDAIAQPTPVYVDAATRSTSLFQHAFNHRGILFVAIAAFSCWAFDVPPFIQGVLASLCSMIIFSKFCLAISGFINQSLSKVLSGGEKNASACPPERGSFAIPNYGTMPVCTVPSVEEHKQLKTYSGWMNEINNYDPTNYHISMTRSVFVKLDGSKLSICSTNARIPKRSTWNEQPIDRKSITFTKRSCYDLIGAHIEMCPKGLARKR